MRRRSSTGGKPIKARRRKTMTLKRRIAPKAVRSSSDATHETEVARLTPRTERVVGAEDGDVGGAASYIKFAWRTGAGVPGPCSRRRPGFARLLSVVCSFATQVSFVSLLVTFRRPPRRRYFSRARSWPSLRGWG